MSLATLTSRLSSGQHQTPLAGHDPATVSLINNGQGDTESARKGIDGLFGIGLAGQGVVDFGAGILDLSLISGTLDDLAQLSSSGNQGLMGGAADNGLSGGQGVESGAGGEALTAGSVSSPDLPTRDAFAFVTNPADPLGRSDELTAEILMLGSRHGGANPPPPTSCTVTGGQVVGTNQVEGVNFTDVLATFTASSPQCTDSDFTAAIDYGDNQSSPGVVSADGNGGFDVTTRLPHAYMEEGSSPITVSILDPNHNPLDTLNGTVTVTDAPLHWDTDPPTFNWSYANNTNQIPRFTSNPGPQTTAEGAAVNLQLQATDPDGDSVSIGAVGLPPGLSISTSGLISGTVDYSAYEDGGGSYTVTAVVADGHGASASMSIPWTVTDTPRSPVFTNPGDQTSAEGDLPGAIISATDPDGRPLTYSATGLPPGVSIDPETGFLSGAISPTAANESPYTASVSVSDGMFTVNQPFNWTVTHLGLTNPGSQSNVNGDAVSLQLQANDVDGDLLTYGLANGSSLPPGLTLTSTGLITGPLGPNADAKSPYTVTVTADDGFPAHLVSQTFTWTIAHLGLTNPGNQVNADQDTVSLQLQGHDADTDPLTYTLTMGTLPPNLTLASNGLISGTIAANADARSPYSATVTASDGHGNSASQTFTWTVTHVLLGTPGDQNTGLGDTVSLQLHAHDNDDANLTYTATGLPPGLAINASTGLISGTMAASADTSNPYTVTVTADDANPANLVSQTFSWSVFAHVTIDNPNNRSNADGDMVSLPISASDPEDGDALTYSAQGLPQSLSIDSNTGLIQGQLAGNADMNSPYMVTITATDANNGNYSASQTFTWTVAPVGLVNPGTQYNADSDTLGGSMFPALQLQGRGSSLTYSVSSTNLLPPGLMLDSTTGRITGQLDLNDDASSPYTVTVTATDSNHHSASQTFTWIVTHVGLINPGDQSNADNDNVSLQLQGRDADHEGLTYSVSPTTPLPPGLTLVGNTISDPLDANDDANSPYTVTVIASDGHGNSTSQTFTWTVAPRITITPPDDQLNADGDSVSVQVAASDAHGYPLTYSLMGQPGNLKIDNSGLITGNIGTTDDMHSPYLVTVTATDKDNVMVSQQFLWNVAHLLVTPPGDQSNVDGDVVALQIQSQHADTTPVTYSAQGLPPNLSIDPNSGLISGKLSKTADSGSPYTVTVVATEGSYSAGQTFTWTVSPLIVMGPAEQRHVAGTTVSLPIHTRYNDTVPLTFSATGLPPGLSINRQTGVISGTITRSSVWRRYNVGVVATDGPHRGTTAFTWTVLPPGNQPPVITNPGDQVNNEDDTIALPIKANDPDGDPLTYSATGLPSGLSIDPNSGWITGSLDDGSFKDTSFQVTVTVNDGNGDTASQTFNWLFEAPALTATAAAVSPTEGIPFSGIVATFTNADLGSSEFADEYDVTIDWGDGTALDTGTVTGANGSYSVLGNHLYQETRPQPFPITVTITDENLASAKVTIMATVADAAVTATPVPVSLVKSSTVLVPVATFTDLNPYDSSYSATITWGDGSSNSGTVSGLGGKFVVSGRHPNTGYGTSGSYTVGVTILDGSTPVAMTSTTAAVADYVEGPINLDVVFTDDDQYATKTDYTATINWGDGSSPTGGTINSTQLAQEFTLDATHTYAAGQYTVTVTIQDVGGSSITSPPQTINSTISVAERPLTVYTAAPVYATAGVPLNNTTVALFVDPDPAGASRSAMATVDWGDGMSGQRTVSSAGGIFSVSGSHTYTATGTYPLSVSFQPASAPLIPLVFGATVLLVNNQGPPVSQTIKDSKGKVIGREIITADGVKQGQILASFESLVGNPPTLKAAAALENGDHFNWYQIVTRDDHPPFDAKGKRLKVPYVDPPPGGYGKDPEAKKGQQESGLRWADYLPWFYNENNTGKPADAVFVAANIKSKTEENLLRFSDAPSDPHDETTVSFKTWLVLVNSKGALVSFFGGFSWDFVKSTTGVEIANVKLLNKSPVDAEYKNLVGGFKYP